MTDLEIRGGLVVSGLGSPPFVGSVMVSGDLITAVTHSAGVAQVAALAGQAHNVIDASGMVVCPGFVDAHVHGEQSVLDGGPLPQATMQGVTTYIVGQDGCSFAPGSAAWLDYANDYFGAVNGRPSFPRLPLTIGDFLQLVDRRSSVNVAALVPNGNLRFDVMGLRSSSPTSAELGQMRVALERGLADGAVGLSSGMDYVPSRMAGPDEMSFLAGAVAEGGAVYVSHIRGYGQRVGEGLGELFDVARVSRAPIHVSHLWGPAAEIGALLDGAASDGIDCSYDTYPYLKGNSILAMGLLPAGIQGDGPAGTLSRIADPLVRAELRAAVSLDDLGRLTFGSIASPRYAGCEGRPLVGCALDAGEHPVDFACDVLLASHLDVGVIMGRRGFDESDMAALLHDDRHMLSSDGIFVGRHPHPRGWGAFARVLGRHDYDWPAAVGHLATSACRRFGLAGRGTLEAGCIADVAVIDPTSIGDLSTYDDPRRPARGVRDVLVSGVAVLRQGELTGATPGRAVRRHP